jgi:haloalkane dehalogenase
MTTAQEATPVKYEGLTFPELPYRSRWIEVNGVKLHYMEGGDPTADPVLFLHGIPTWSYIWRDVMPVVEPVGRVIALDFVGFGRSDKLPANAADAGYALDRQLTYLEGFVDALKLRNITFVVQDLGSAAGFTYAAKHAERIKGLVFFEAAVPPFFPPTPEAFKAMGPLAEFFTQMVTPGTRETLVLDQNMFIEQVIPANVVRKLSDREMNAYRAPFPTPQDRLAILWGGPMNFANPAFVKQIADYVAWLETTEVPMLYLYASPGLINPDATRDWVKANIHNAEIQSMGEGKHFFQEDHPAEIGRAIADWIKRVSIKK